MCCLLQIGHPDEQDDAAQHDQHTKHSSGTAAGGAELEDEDEDSDDEDDEDFDPAHSEEEEEAAGQGLPAKKAKVEAAQKQGGCRAAGESGRAQHGVLARCVACCDAGWPPAGCC